MGNEKIHQLTTNSGQSYKLRLELKHPSGEWISAEYDSFVVEDEITNSYRIRLAGFSGDGGDSMLYTGRAFNSSMFYTLNNIYTS